MNNTHAQTAKVRKQGGGLDLIAWFKAHSAQISETFWFGLCFILFLLLGPFSSIAVLMGLKSLASEECREQMVEPAKV